jgi:very-short-patch-repair endonuclease
MSLPDSSPLPRVISRVDACSRGLSDDHIRWKLQRGLWVSLMPGVYGTRQEPSASDWLAAALVHGGPRSVLSGAAALRQYGFHAVVSADAMARQRQVGLDLRRILLLVPYQSGVVSRGPVRVRRASHLPSGLWLNGLRLAPPVRAVCDLALGINGLDDARALVSEAVQRHRCHPAEFTQELRHTARRGSKPLRTAVAEIVAGARSAPEADAATALNHAGIDGYTQNAPLVVHGHHYVVDFLFEELQAILEIDSQEHHYDRADWEATQDRDAVLQSDGYAVLHIRPSVVKTRAAFIRRVELWLDSRRRQLKDPR